MTETLSVAVRLQNGEIDQSGYWVNGRWAKDKNWLWEHAVRRAFETAKEIGESSVNICYNDGPVVGGVRLN